MRNIMITAAILAGLGTFMAQMANRMTPASASTNAASQAAPLIVNQAPRDIVDSGPNKPLQPTGAACPVIRVVASPPAAPAAELRRSSPHFFPNA